MADEMHDADGRDEPRLRRADRRDGNDLRHCGLAAFAAWIACQTAGVAGMSMWRMP